MAGGPDYLSDNETQICQPGQVVVNAGADRWVTWANGGSILSTAMVGLCLKTTLPGGALTVVTLGRFPFAAYNLGPGDASPIIAGTVPTRGTFQQGAVIGACDASGEIFMLPFGCSGDDGGPRIAVGGTVLPEEPIVNFIGVTGVDNPGAGRTDITVTASGGGNVFVYRVGATPGGNVYNSFAAAYAARIAVQGFAIIEIDSTAAPGTVAPGAYNLFDTKLLGAPQPLGTMAILNIPNGVTFSNLTDIENLNIEVNTTGSVISLTTGLQTVILRNSVIGSFSIGHFWDLSGDAILSILLFDQSVLSATLGTSVLLLEGGGSSPGQRLFMYAYNGSTIGEVVSGAYVSSVLAAGDDTTTVSPTQPLYVGPYSVHYLSQASQVSYSPAIPGNWSPAPTLVAPALDQLAARPSGGGSAPLTPPSNGSWAVTNWYIDPLSGNDANDGLTSGTPFQTYAKLAATWGTVSPILAQNTTIHFLSSQTSNTDPVVFRPIIRGALVTLKGENPFLIVGGSLNSVVSKNTSAGANAQLTVQITGITLGLTGAIIENTTVGKTSRAWVQASNSGVYTITQPVPLSTLGTPGSGEVNTWANTDTVSVFNLVNVDLLDIRPTIDLNNGGNLDIWQIDGGVGPSPSPMFVDAVRAYECRFQRNLTSIMDQNILNASLELDNCYFDALNSVRSAVINSGVAQSSIFFYGTCLVSNDFMGAGGIILASGSSLSIGSGLNLTASLQATNAYISGPANPPDAIWGGGNIFLYGTSRFYLQEGGGQTFTSAFTSAPLVSPGIWLNGSAAASVFTPSTGAWSAGLVATNPANLDVTGAVFANPGGASVGSTQ